MIDESELIRDVFDKCEALKLTYTPRGHSYVWLYESMSKAEIKQLIKNEDLHRLDCYLKPILVSIPLKNYQCLFDGRYLFEEQSLRKYALNLLTFLKDNRF